MGGFPDLDDINVTSDRQEKYDEFIKRILMLVHKDRLIESSSTTNFSVPPFLYVVILQPFPLCSMM
jgi:hypothetical protein